VGLGLIFLCGYTMNKQQAYVGMLVVFGREQTRGKIVKLNSTRARVESLEQWDEHPSGALFNVPYSLLTENDQAPAT
jgi:hypothetical protein